jgi:hypothetical protein
MLRAHRPFAKWSTFQLYKYWHLPLSFFQFHFQEEEKKVVLLIEKKRVLISTKKLINGP